MRPQQGRRGLRILQVSELLLLCICHVSGLYPSSNMRHRSRIRPSALPFPDSSLRTQIRCFIKSANQNQIGNDDTELAEDFANTSDNNMSYDLDVDSVSEAEALLACRAYLQRKNKLGEWYEWEARKEQREAAKRKGDYLDVSLVSDSELVAQQQQLHHETTSNDDVNVGRSPQQQHPPAFDGFQTSWNGGPSASHIRRSETAKRTWADPDFRARWYKGRWGSNRVQDDNVNQQTLARDKLLEERVRALKPEFFLANPLVSAMTEEEIAEAIRIYVVSRKQGTATRKKVALARKAGRVSAELPQDGEKEPELPILSTPEMMAKKRLERAAAAKQRYQQRLLNSEANNSTATLNMDDICDTKRRPRKKVLQVQRPGGLTPRDAMARINVDLDAGERPVVDDVELILQAGRLSNRRQLLIRILRDCFGLRGKCVPTNVTSMADDGLSELTFVTSTPIEQVGAFVLYKLKES